MARPKASEGEKINKDTVGLRASQWEYIALYMPTGNPSEQLREALDTLRRMRPDGPNGFGHTPGPAPRQRVPYKAVDAYAQAHSLTRTEAVAELVKAALRNEATA